MIAQVIASFVMMFPMANPHVIRTLAGTGEAGYSGDGAAATKARLNGPFDVALDGAANVFFSDTGNHCIRRVDAKSRIITTVAGCGRKGFSGDGGPATEAELNEPYGIELDRDGNLYFVDRLNYRIRRVDGKTGVITTIAGTGQQGFSGDGGPADKATMREPNGIALDGNGRLVIADVADHRLRVVDLKTGLISTMCGSGKKEHAGDGGPYRDAALLGPRAVAFGPDGALFICEREGHCIRRINFGSGTIERFAGNGRKGFSGDGGPAAEATFDGPKELDVDRAGNVVVVDTENHAIRRIDAASGIITTIAGTGKKGNRGDGGPATSATLGRPHGVCIGPDGVIYIGDTLSHRIRIVTQPGN